MAKPEAVVESVKMSDGRIVEFPGKRKLQKNSLINDATGEVSIVLDWRNGETRTFTPRKDMYPKFVGHGAEQKLGDEIAGLKAPDGAEASIDDCILAVDDLIERLNAGEWTTKREGTGMGGTSVLLQAIVQVTLGPDPTPEAKAAQVEKVKNILKTKTQAEKMALRNGDKYGPTVRAIESAKAKADTKVDVKALESEFAV